MNTTWRIEFSKVEKEIGESIIECTLTEEEKDVEFDNGFGGSEGKPFTAWTKTWVLFPICYDGSEWVGRAPRNPSVWAMVNPMSHQGGE